MHSIFQYLFHHFNLRTNKSYDQPPFSWRISILKHTRENLGCIHWHILHIRFTMYLHSA
mgnify:CR=1 FL=1